MMRRACCVRGLNYLLANCAMACACLLVLGCSDDATPPPTVEQQRVEPAAPASPATTQQREMSPHEQMRAALALLSAESRDDNAFVGDRNARRLRRALSDLAQIEDASPFKRWEANFELGRAELKLGHEQKALDLLRRADELLPADSPIKLRKKTWFELGIAALRLGETQNCCLKHSSESCIVPIQGAGLHTKKEGSRMAMSFFLKVLEHPAAEGAEEERLEFDEAARWLLNIAAMTLNEYPDSVPQPHRVPTEFFRSSIEFPRFVNVMPHLGLDTFNLCGSVVIDDFDSDGDLDIVTCTWDVSGQTRVFRNNGDGTFADVTEASGLIGFYGGLNLKHADYDNDGDLDIFIMRGAWLKAGGQHPSSLLRNDGQLKFTDVTFAVGLANMLPTKTSAWADYDNDGDLDLFIGNETSPEIDAPCRLFRNDAGKFLDVAAEAGVQARVFSMGSNWGDYNNDGWPDLYLSATGPNLLYRNNRDGTFTDVASELGVDNPNASFSTWFWDYDNDGHLDIYVGATSGTVGVLASDIRFELMHLYRNRGDGTFENVAPQVDLKYPASPMGSNFGDLNNDGYLDFYLATGNVPFSEIQPNVMFLNDRGRKFHNITMAGGFGHLQKGHGVSFADIDNDGDQDVYVQLGGAYPVDRFNDALFRNPGFAGQNSITLQLEGRQSNRCAIGARLKLDIIEEDGTQRSIHHLLSGGSSFGNNPFRRTIGIGTAKKVERLTIRWPRLDLTQEVTNLTAGRFYRIAEQQPPQEHPLTPFNLGP